MDDESPDAVKDTLMAIESGDTTAVSRLVPLLYAELREHARALMARRPPGDTLEPTALVHEAYLRLKRKGGAGGHGRAYFFAAATRAMRDILVEAARRKAALKRGGDHRRQDLELESPVIQGPLQDDILALDEALGKLEKDDPRKAEVVHLRFFGGLGMGEIAELLDISEATVKREWRYVRAWLHKELSGDRRGGGRDPTEA